MNHTQLHTAFSSLPLGSVFRVMGTSGFYIKTEAASRYSFNAARLDGVMRYFSPGDPVLRLRLRLVAGGGRGMNNRIRSVEKRIYFSGLPFGKIFSPLESPGVFYMRVYGGLGSSVNVNAVNLSTGMLTTFSDKLEVCREYEITIYNED